MSNLRCVLVQSAQKARKTMV
uniref:Uncharacterized protein n=1 Tax=Rhizophora mucronata TaxID=61149 RepID=A0A2P2NPA1_RHIMU